MKCIVGVDGGGTKTLALAESLDAHWQGRGVAGSSNLHAVGFEAACAAIESAIAQAVGSAEIAALCFGLAGAGRAPERLAFTRWAQQTYPGAVVQVVGDAEILLAAGAPSGAALALICGTGSLACGRTAGGEFVRCGGWGYLFGDEGSGFAIGAAALRGVLQAYDGRGPQTALTERILAHRRLKTPPELIEDLYEAASPRSEIAALAPLVEEAAQQNDPIALSILEEAAAELTRMVAALYPRLGQFAPPLALGGGVLLQGSSLRQAFLRGCAAQGLAFSQVIAVSEPARGALALARQES